MNLECKDRLLLLKDLHELCYESSLFQRTSVELAYLTLAILFDMKCELNPLNEFVKLLKSKFNNEHHIWKFILLEPTVICINCTTEIILENASFCLSMNGWLGHNCCVDAEEVEGYYEEVSLIKG